MVNILDYTLDELKIWMKDNEESAFRAKQVFEWIYKGQYDFDLMKNISSSTKNKLKKFFYIGFPTIIETLESKEDKTRKLLLRLNDDNIVECVIMSYKHGNSVCVSTQVGCRMGCKFCASTIDGMIRNLTAGEILSQIIL